MRFHLGFFSILFWLGLGSLQASAALIVDQTQGQIKLRSESFITQGYQGQNSSISYLGAEIENSGNKSDGLFVSLRGEFSPTVPLLSYMNVSEVYFKNSEFVFGRKKENWSALDEAWHLGLFQPQFRWNPIMPESQGQTGFFIEINSAEQKVNSWPWQVLLFGSFLNIPDQGTSYQIKDGQFEALNPWFPVPPKAAQFDEQGKVIDQFSYQVVKPDTNAILFNSSYLAQASLGQLDQGFFAQVAAGYKPSQQLLLSADGNITPNNTIQANINPTVYLHSLSSLDLQYKAGSFVVGAGTIRERPKEVTKSNVYTFKSYGESQIQGAFLGLKDYYGLSFLVSTISMQRDSDVIVGPKSKELGYLLPGHFLFEKAWKADLKYNMNGKNRSSINVSYLAHPAGEFEQFSTNLSYFVDAHLVLSGGTLLIRSSNSGSDMYSFQNNDLAQMGVGYAF